ncbi:hypothetical protein WA158_001239 [Blastocystis sp. Blastoise]
MIHWAFVWFIVSALVVVLNKSFFSTLKCPYAITLTLIHMVSSCFYSFMVKLFYPSYYNNQVLSKKTFNKLVFMSVLFIVNIVSANYSLRFCSLALDQMVRCTIPAWTAILQYFLIGEKTSFRVCLSLIPVILGSAFLWITKIGFIILVFSVLVSTLKGVITKIVLSGEQKVSPLQTLFINSSFGALELVPFSLYVDNVFYTEWIPNSTTKTLLLLAFNGFLAFTVNVSNFEAVKQTSPLVMNVCGNLKQVIMVLFSVYFFGQSITPLGLAGAIMTIIGSLWYTYERYNSMPSKQSVQTEENDPEASPLLMDDAEKRKNNTVQRKY